MSINSITSREQFIETLKDLHDKKNLGKATFNLPDGSVLTVTSQPSLFKSLFGHGKTRMTATLTDSSGKVCESKTFAYNKERGVHQYIRDHETLFKQEDSVMTWDNYLKSLGKNPKTNPSASPTQEIPIIPEKGPINESAAINNENIDANNIEIDRDDDKKVDIDGNDLGNNKVDNDITNIGNGNADNDIVDDHLYDYVGVGYHLDQINSMIDDVGSPSHFEDCIKDILKEARKCKPDSENELWGKLTQAIKSLLKSAKSFGIKSLPVESSPKEQLKDIEQDINREIRRLNQKQDKSAQEVKSLNFLKDFMRNMPELNELWLDFMCGIRSEEASNNEAFM